LPSGGSVRPDSKNRCGRRRFTAPPRRLCASWQRPRSQQTTLPDDQLKLLLPPPSGLRTTNSAGSPAAPEQHAEFGASPDKLVELPFPQGHLASALPTYESILLILWNSVLGLAGHVVGPIPSNLLGHVPCRCGHLTLATAVSTSPEVGMGWDVGTFSPSCAAGM
jgi:hypothetical protein